MRQYYWMNKNLVLNAKSIFLKISNLAFTLINVSTFLFCVISFILSTVFTERSYASFYNSQFVALDSIQPESSLFKFFGVFRFDSFEYLSVLPESGNLNKMQYFSTRLGFVGSGKDNNWGYGGDFQAGKFSFGSTNYSVQELYTYLKLEGAAKILGGRKKYNWSHLDSYWKTSLWQPNYALDYLRPEEQGLFGIFFEFERPGFRFMTFTTPAFIPNMGTDVREESGELVSDSRWFKQPNSKYDFNGRLRTISYKLSIPEIRGLISKPAVGFNLGYGDQKSGFWLNQSLGYKPVNELILKREGFAETTEKNIKVIVSPDVAYHAIASIDFGYTFHNLKVIGSYLEDHPKEKIPTDDWVSQVLGGLRAYSLMIENDFGSTFIRQLKMQAGYLKVYGGNIYDVDSKNEKDTYNLFTERVNFYNALMLKAQGYLFSLFKTDFITRFSYLRDFDQRGSVVNSEFQFYPSKNWAVLFGADVISVDTEDDSSGFMNQYRANDRFYAGVNYVF